MSSRDGARRRPRVGRLALPLLFASTLALGGCGLTADPAPSPIVIPPTNELSTESSTSPTTTTTRTTDDSARALPSWSIGRVISMAPRVQNSRYRQGSVTERSALQDTSGFHFSTPDAGVNCSTGTNGTSTLACRINDDSDERSRPSDLPANCVWAGNLVTLNADEAEHGACSNLYPVLYRSSIVDFGHTISISRFSCLVDTSGMYCLESRSQSGFSITPTGYHRIFASDRAPESLAGIDTDTPSETPPPGLSDTADGEGSPSETPTTTTTTRPR